MTKLSYEDYFILGGRVSPEEFPILEMEVRKRIDYRTFERIDEPDDDIKLLMVKLIAMQHEFNSQINGVSGSSNDGVSVSYVSPDVARKDFEAKADTLIDSVVGDFAYRGIC